MDGMAHPNPRYCTYRITCPHMSGFYRRGVFIPPRRRQLGWAIDEAVSVDVNRTSNHSYLTSTGVSLDM
jgi:hypothetical protein